VCSPCLSTLEKSSFLSHNKHVCIYVLYVQMNKILVKQSMKTVGSFGFFFFCSDLKGILRIHLNPFTHPQVVANLCEFLSSAEL